MSDPTTTSLDLAPLDSLHAAVASIGTGTKLVRCGGTISEVQTSHLRATGLAKSLQLGEFVELECPQENSLAIVVAIDEGGAILKPLDQKNPVGLQTRVWRKGVFTINPSSAWKGRIVDALGQPIDDLGPLAGDRTALPVDRQPPSPMHRQRTGPAIATGVRAIDSFAPLCQGQRLGIFAGSGIGKSTLLAMLTRAQGFDTVVIALVGERGREVREFFEDTLQGQLGNIVSIVATGDQSPALRHIAPRTAMTVAEHFRDRGETVLLIVDSVTRFAHAARDVAIAGGALPVARGYPPNVFSELAHLLERAGPGPEGTGSITGIFSVLVDGDDHNDPIADSIRGILDGHIVLSRQIAEQGRFPAIDLLASISRLAPEAWTPEQQDLITQLRKLISRYEDSRDLRLLDGYKHGEDPELDKAVTIVPALFDALVQSPADPISTDPFQDISKALANAAETPNTPS